VRGANAVSATFWRTATAGSREPKASEEIPASDRERAEGFLGVAVRVIASLGESISSDHEHIGGRRRTAGDSSSRSENGAFDTERGHAKP
jgi:hypothetical protein